MYDTGISNILGGGGGAQWEIDLLFVGKIDELDSG